MTHLSRRSVLAVGLSLSSSALSAPPRLARRFEALEQKLGGHIGLFAVRGGQTLAWREKDRFAYCSVFKWVLAAAVLEASQRKQLDLSERLRWTEKDLLEPSGATRPHLADGLTVAELCAGAVGVSDNTATNLLEKKLGGIDALRAFTRRLGDEVMRFDRLEPELNTNLRDDPRDTTTPEAMTRLLERVFSGDVLTDASKAQLFAWLKATSTGLKRIRAVVPAQWEAGDKTGTSENGAANDVAVLRPSSSGAPIYLSIFTNGAKLDLDASAEAIAGATRLVLPMLT